MRAVEKVEYMSNSWYIDVATKQKWFVEKCFVKAKSNEESDFFRYNFYVVGRHKYVLF